MLDVLRAIRDEEFSSRASIGDASGVAERTVTNYLTGDDNLGKCVEKHGRYSSYSLTELGERVLEVD